MCFLALPSDIIKYISNFAPSNNLSCVNKQLLSLFRTSVTNITPRALIPFLNNVKKVETENLESILLIPNFTQLVSLTIHTPTSRIKEKNLLSLSSLKLRGNWDNHLEELTCLTQIKRLSVALVARISTPVFLSLTHLKIQNVSADCFNDLCKLTLLVSLKVTGNEKFSAYNFTQTTPPHFEFTCFFNLFDILNSFIKKKDQYLQKLIHLKVIERKCGIVPFLNYLIKDCPFERQYESESIVRLIKLGFPLSIYTFYDRNALHMPFLDGNGNLFTALLQKFPEQLTSFRTSFIAAFKEACPTKRNMYFNLMVKNVTSSYLLYIIEMALFNIVDFNNLINRDDVKPHIPSLSQLVDDAFYLRISQNVYFGARRENFNLLKTRGFDPNKEMFNCAIRTEDFDLFPVFPQLTFAHFKLAFKKKKLTSFVELLKKTKELPPETDGAGNNLFHLVAGYPKYLEKLNLYFPSHPFLSQTNLLNETPFQTAERYGWKDSLPLLRVNH